MSKLNTVKNGKGDKPRPVKNQKEYLENFDNIFGKKEKTLANEEKPCEDQTS